jgi:hypothetical protein
MLFGSFFDSLLDEPGLDLLDVEVVGGSVGTVFETDGLSVGGKDSVGAPRGTSVVGLQEGKSDAVALG